MQEVKQAIQEANVVSVLGPSSLLQDAFSGYSKRDNVSLN
jgi:hypothetical protein